MKAGRFAVVLLACAGACQRPGAGAPDAASARDQAVEPEAEGADAPAGEAGREGSDPETTPAEPAPSSGDATPSEPAVPDLAVVVPCKRLCDRVQQTCDEAAERRCRAACKGYIAQAEGCEEEYQDALRCQAKADQASLCANVTAPPCVDLFEKIASCKRGEKVKPATGPTLPAGWKRVTDDKLGFTIALPASAALDSAAKLRTWRAQEGSIEYLAAQLSAPHEPITSKVLVRLVIEFVGLQCQKNLKLHGQFEIGDEVAILFDAACNDGTEWHGMLRARPDQALATAFHAAPNSGGVTGPFFYSYKRLPR